MKTRSSSISPLLLACLAAVCFMPASSQAAPVHTPAPGTAERKAILDAVRPFVRDLANRRDIVFVVDELHVCQDWAWFLGRPQTPDGTHRFEGVSALVRKVDGGWMLTRVLAMEGGEVDDPEAAEAQLWAEVKREFPGLPQALIDIALPIPGPEVLTPAPGSPERRAILDAVRPTVRQLTGQDSIVFVVVDLHVCGDWAWFQGLPQTPDGTSRFESISTLVHRAAEGWRIARVWDIEAGEVDDLGLAWDQFWIQLKREFPDLPQNLVDVARGCSQ